MGIKRVIDIDYAIKLKGLGVKQKSLFYYIRYYNPGSKYFVAFEGRFDKTHHENDMFSAFTLDELLNSIPIINGSVIQLLKGISLFEGLVYSAKFSNLSDDKYFTDSCAQNAVAKLLIHLLSANILNVEELLVC